MTRNQKGSGNIFSNININSNSTSSSSKKSKNTKKKNKHNKTKKSQLNLINPISTKSSSYIPTSQQRYSIEEIVEVFRSVFPASRYVVAHYNNIMTRSGDELIDIFYNKHIKDIDGNIVDGTKPNDTRYYRDIDTCISLSIKIKEDAIVLDLLKYDQPNKCKISGSELLYLLYQAAKKLDYNIVIEGDASSKILYSDEENEENNCSVRFAVYSILLTGKSWYNKYGYYSPDYNDEIRHNDRVRSLNMSNYFIDEEDKKDRINGIIDFIKKYNKDVNITKYTSVEDAIKHIDKIINKNSSNRDIVCEAATIINKFDIDRIMYTNQDNRKNNIPKDLVLNIRDTNTQALYERLGRTRTITLGGKTRKNKTKRFQTL